MEESNRKYNIKLIESNNGHMLKVDMGDHYYDGMINLNSFPSEIQDPISVVQKSLNNYFSQNTNITGIFTPTTDISQASYTIIFKCTQEFFTIERTIVINMTWHMKEQMDYINERFIEMQSEIKNLKNSNDELKFLLNKVEKKLQDLDRGEDDEEEEQETVVVPPKVETVTTAKRRQRQ
jgi:hypothetical protein